MTEHTLFGVPVTERSKEEKKGGANSRLRYFARKEIASETCLAFLVAAGGAGRADDEDAAALAAVRWQRHVFGWSWIRELKLWYVCDDAGPSRFGFGKQGWSQRESEERK